MADWNGRIRKKKSDRGSLKPTLHNMAEAIRQAIQEEVDAVYEDIDRGLDKAARYAEQKLENATPVDSGITKGSWKVDFKYTNVRYINNVSLNENDIPIVNLLEFGSRGKPFVRKTIEQEEQNINNIIKGEIEHGKA